LFICPEELELKLVNDDPAQTAIEVKVAIAFFGLIGMREKKVHSLILD